MRNETNRSRNSMVIAVAMGILVMTLGSPAFAGARCGVVQHNGGPIVKQAPITPMQPIVGERVNVRRATFLSVLPFMMVGGWQGAAQSMLFAVQTSSAATVGMSDDPIPY